MAMKITINEASPRKWRAEPSDRGIGGKWGPGKDALYDIKVSREISAKEWNDALRSGNPQSDDKFVDMLSDELGDACSHWDEQYIDIFRVQPSYYNINEKNGCTVELILDPEMPNENTARRFSNILSNKIDASIRFVDVVVDPHFMTASETPVDEDAWFVRVSLKVDLSDMWGRYWLEEGVTRRGACLDISEAFSDAIAYIYKLWKPLMKEVSRRFGTSNNP